MSSDLVFLRHPQPEDAADLLDLARTSVDLHRPWIYAFADARAVESYIMHSDTERFAGLLVCLRESGTIVGVCNLSEIVRGHFQNAYLGFYGRAGFEGRGYMTRGVRLALEWAFERLGLHRVEANVQPGNTRSRQLVERCGFRLEGFSPRYLEVGGEWRDHERWAVTAEEWPARPTP